MFTRLLFFAPLLVASRALLINEPNMTITWTPCEPNLMQTATTTLLCGNITVPLDYTDPDCYANHILELVKAPALSKISRGTILLNFGGPGADGRKSLALAGAKYLNITGGEHDLVTWDPRGTARSFLRFSCYDTDLERQLATSPNPLAVHLDENDQAAARAFAQAKVVADVCAEKRKDIGSYVGTSFTARDAMRIVDALGQGPLINYYGLSYGTALGATIAAMFPDRINTMVLDGVLNPHEYWNSLSEINMIADTDKAFRAMLSECVEAGPQRCALAKDNITATQLEAKIHHFTESLKSNPIPLPPSLIEYSSTTAGTLLDYTAIKSILHGSLYDATSFRDLAQMLSDLMDGKVPPSVVKMRNLVNLILRDVSEDESFLGIHCGDKSLRASKLSDIEDILKEGLKASWIGGSGQIFGKIALPCARWNFNAKERYTGDFRVRTKNPVLLMSSTYDPATPLVSAYNVSAGFEGSVVVERKGFGHCAMSQNSKTAEKALREYFQYGVLPETGAQYEVDVSVF